MAALDPIDEEIPCIGDRAMFSIERLHRGLHGALNMPRMKSEIP
jgi:hypothetical protein